MIAKLKRVMAGLVAGAVAVAAEHLPLAGTFLGGLAPTAQLVAVVVAAALVGFLIWKRSK